MQVLLLTHTKQPHAHAARATQSEGARPISARLSVVLWPPLLTWLAADSARRCSYFLSRCAAWSALRCAALRCRSDAAAVTCTSQEQGTCYCIGVDTCEPWNLIWCSGSERAILASGGEWLSRIFLPRVSSTQLNIPLPVPPIPRWPNIHTHHPSSPSRSAHPPAQKHLWSIVLSTSSHHAPRPLPRVAPPAHAPPCCASRPVLPHPCWQMRRLVLRPGRPCCRAGREELQVLRWNRLWREQQSSATTHKPPHTMAGRAAPEPRFHEEQHQTSPEVWQCAHLKKSGV